MYSKTNRILFWTEEFVQFIQVFALHRFKLHKHLVDGTVTSIWFRQVFGLLRVRFRQVSIYSEVRFMQDSMYLDHKEYGFVLLDI